MGRNRRPFEGACSSFRKSGTMHIFVVVVVAASVLRTEPTNQPETIHAHANGASRRPRRGRDRSYEAGGLSLPPCLVGDLYPRSCVGISGWHFEAMLMCRFSCPLSLTLMPVPWACRSSDLGIVPRERAWVECSPGSVQTRGRGRQPDLQLQGVPHTGRRRRGGPRGLRSSKLYVQGRRK